MRSMCEALATRLRNPEVLKSPCLASEQSPQHLQIMCNDIMPGPSDAPSSSGGYNSPIVGLTRAEGLAGIGAANPSTGTPTAERVRASIGSLRVDVGVGQEEAQEAAAQEQADENGESEDGDDDEGSDWDDWSEDEDVSAVEE